MRITHKPVTNPLRNTPSGLLFPDLIREYILIAFDIPEIKAKIPAALPSTNASPANGFARI